MTREITTHSAEETIAFGRTLMDLLAPPKLVLLRGDLGAGKTTLVKGIAAGFEAAEEEDVTSPTLRWCTSIAGREPISITLIFTAWILSANWRRWDWMICVLRAAFC